MRNRRKGQALAEFTIVFPLLLAFLSISIDLARFLTCRLKLEDIAHDAARFATIRDPLTGNYPSTSQVDARIAAQLTSSLSQSTVTRNLSAAVAGEPAVSVRIRCVVSPFSPTLMSVLPASFAISAEVWHPKR
jgi:Flp pilus assembly protein TadG